MIEAISGDSSLNMKDDDALLDSIREVYTSEYDQMKRWCIGVDPLKQWIRCTCEPGILPEQGWKLHVSANIQSAKTVLHRVLPVLLAESSSFKVAASLQKLALLNQGEGGASQIGKFITIYPKDDSEAVQLAARLDEVTRGMTGPTVPSDRPLHPGSLVHYRYGGMASHLRIQTPIGKIEPAIRTPNNELVPDRRLPYYEVPDWAVDPFISAGIAGDLPEPSRLIGEIYLIMAVMFISVNHSVYLAADLEHARSCVIKGPGYAGRNNPAYTISRTGIQHEAEILTRLAPDSRFPTLYDLVEQNDNLFLVMEDLEGKTLDKHINHVITQGQYMSVQQVITWGMELADLFGTIHAKNLIYGDVKPSNVIISSNGQLHLIDFDIAHDLSDEDPLWKGRGTPGYMSPQMNSRQPMTISDDIYGLGALLYFMLTNAEPSAFPHQHALLDRPIELLRPGTDGQLKDVIARCLHKNPNARYASMAALKGALAAAERDETSVSTSYEAEFTEERGKEARTRYRELAGKLLNTLCAVAEPAVDNQGLAWTSTHPLAYGLKSRDLNIGNAGIVLTLAELTEEFAEPGVRSVLTEGVRWLRATPPIGNPPLPGLYVGEAGVGAALLRAGQVLHDEELIIAAVEQGRQIVSLSYTSPDLYNGIAGRLLFHLLLWDQTGEKEHLDAAIVCGEQLLTQAIVQDNGEVSWASSEDHVEESNRLMLGYAHGAAGIADALLDLFEVTGDERFLPLIQGAGRWLLRQAVPSLDDESGLSWPKYEGEQLVSAFWCHGSAGIARFFLHAARCDVIPHAGDIATRAARMVARTTRWAGPTQCHGLSGNIELLLDMYQATSDRSYLTEAFTLGRLLEAFACEQAGHLVFPSDIPHTFTPDYMVGYSGVALCLLRLSAPERLPRQLSRAGFCSRRPDVRDIQHIVNVS